MTKSKSFVCLLAAGALGLGSVSSFAQGYEHHDRHDRQELRHDRQELRHDRRELRHDRREFREDHYYYGARGPEWRRGGRLPAQYRGHQYVVDNWRAHRLAPPPRGYHWVQVGNDYVLAAIATGIIANLILNNS